MGKPKVGLPTSLPFLKFQFTFSFAWNVLEQESSLSGTEINYS